MEPSPLPTARDVGASGPGPAPQPSETRLPLPIPTSSPFPAPSPSPRQSPGGQISALGAMRARASASAEEPEPEPGAKREPEAAAEVDEEVVYTGTAARDTDPQTLLILVGLPGSGKSTFAHALETTQGGRKWTRASQDDSASKRRAEVEDTVRRALARGDNVVVDRVNFDAAQRAHFTALAQRLPSPPRIFALVLTAPEAVLRERLLSRTGHPTLTDPSTALNVLGRMGRQLTVPQPSEGFARVLVLEWRGEEVGDVLAMVEREGWGEGGGGMARARGPGRGRGSGRGRGGWGRGRGMGVGVNSRGRGGGRRRSGGHVGPNVVPGTTSSGHVSGPVAGPPPTGPTRPLPGSYASAATNGGYGAYNYNSYAHGGAGSYDPYGYSQPSGGQNRPGQ